MEPPTANQDEFTAPIAVLTGSIEIPPFEVLAIGYENPAWMELVFAAATSGGAAGSTAVAAKNAPELLQALRDAIDWLRRLPLTDAANELELERVRQQLAELRADLPQPAPEAIRRISQGDIRMEIPDDDVA